ncbi:hypothetical protein [Lentzea sp. NPDC003310]|uniref:hypothetical protein n=1 Tax=Lentzea sp. NPDC003310 TaxID=3154447 RepID=UPI0033B1CCE9
MDEDMMHIAASRSWWDGSAKTLCGIKIAKPNTVWFAWLSSNPRCPACEALHKAR